MGYYVTVEPGTDDLIVGNPQLQLSEVESYDLRVEYMFGELGDLVAVSVFYKTIDDPIESIVVRNPLDFDGSSSALFRTFFNNPNRATLGASSSRRARASTSSALDLAGPSTSRSAATSRTSTPRSIAPRPSSRARSRSSELRRGRSRRFTRLEQSRRLFGQPEWIANADVTFDQPDWGTKATLAFFAISDVLDAAGSAVIGPNGEIVSLHARPLHRLLLPARPDREPDAERATLAAATSPSRSASRT